MDDAVAFDNELLTIDEINHIPYLHDLGKAKLFQDGNPLIYGGAVKEVQGSPEMGDEVIVKVNITLYISIDMSSTYNRAAYKDTPICIHMLKKLSFRTIWAISSDEACITLFHRIGSDCLLEITSKFMDIHYMVSS